LFDMSCSVHSPSPHSFPTRRSSDLLPFREARLLGPALRIVLGSPHVPLDGRPPHDAVPAHPVADLIGVVSPGRLHELRRYCLVQDRKSTRLNSSHVSISYAVFCLKK